MELKSVLLTVIFCFLYTKIVIAEFYYETDTRVIIVSEENPKDGQLRLFRSAAERHLSPIMLRIKDERSQVIEIINYLNTISFRSNEISLITPSANYIATHDASTFALNVAKVALVRDGSVVMGYPMDKNLSSFATPIDHSVENIKKKISELANPAKNDYHPAPVDLDEWKISVKILSIFRKLLVKQKQLQHQQASVYDGKYCAFAGFTKAIKKFLNSLELYTDLSSFGSLQDLCNTLAHNETLSYLLGVVNDYDSLVFKRTDKVIDDAILVKDPKSMSMANHMHSSSYSYAPFTFAEDGQFPFILSNFASGDILIPQRRNDQNYLDRFITDLENHFNGEKNFPTVLIIAVITEEEVTNAISFLKNLKQLTYPKDKINLFIIFQSNNYETNSKEIMKMLKDEEMKKFKEIKVVLSDGKDSLSAYQKAWEISKTSEGNEYVFWVHSSVRFTNNNALRHLMKNNRRVVGPLLELREEEGVLNFHSDREGRKLHDNFLSAPFGDRYQDLQKENVSLVGLLQVPYIFGSILMKIDVVENVELSFNLCPSKCAENDENCHQNIEKRKCETNYFDGLDFPDLEAWGVLCKNINDKGYILYLSNFEDYGIFSFNQSEDTEKEKSENQKKNE